MTLFYRRLLFPALVVGLALANACARSEMGTLSEMGANSAGGADIGLTETGGSSGEGGITGLSGGTSGSLATGGDTGSATGGAGGSTGICDEVPCLASLLSGCLPSGTCTTSSTGYCYSNGVKVQVVISFSGTIDATETVKRDNTICYSIVGSVLISGTTVSYRFRDASGSQVATGDQNLNTSVLTVTCNGGNPTTLSNTCAGAILAIVGNASSCNTGVCTF